MDEFAPYRKLTKKEFKLKSKPWISNEILTKIRERDKLLYKYSNAKELNQSIIIYSTSQQNTWYYMSRHMPLQ